MKNIKNIKTFIAFSCSVLVSVASLFVIAPVPVSAAVDTCTWTGGGASDNFNDATNWTGCDNGNVPENGDNLTFPFNATSISIDNDLLSSVNNLIFTGDSGATDNGSTGIFGDDFTINGSVTVGEKNTVSMSPDTLTIGADVTVTMLDQDSGINLGGTTAIVLGTNTLSFTKAGPYTSSASLAYVSINAPVTGGADSVLSFTGSSISFADPSPSFDGEIQLNNAVLNGGDDLAGSLGTAGKGIIMTNSRISVSPTVALTINDPIEITGNFLGASNSDAQIGTETIYVGGTSGAGLVLAGAVTLGSDILVDPYQGPLTITGPFSGQFLLGITAAYTETSKIVINSSANTSLIPNGDYALVDSDQTLTDNLPAVDLILERGAVLIVNGQRGRIIVSAQASLKGTGTVGAIDVFTGGTLAPGQSPGCLNSGNVSLTSGSTFEAELGGTTVCTGYDQQIVTGTVTLGNATLSTILFGGFTPATGDTFTIINNDGSDAVSGTFAGLVEGATVAVGGYNFTISYVGGDGNDVVLRAGTAPAAPNTGFGTLTTNPLAIFTVTTLAASSVLAINRKYKLQNKGEI